MTREDQWAVVAVHEAGHVVSYLRFGWRFGEVQIRETDDGEVVGNVTSLAGRYDCFAKAICCLAGPLAEERLTGVGLDRQTGSYVDVTMAREALRRIDFVGNLDIAAVIPFTRLMVEHEWPYIQLIAGHLLDRKQLDYAEVVRLFC